MAGLIAAGALLLAAGAAGLSIRWFFEAPGWLGPASVACLCAGLPAALAVAWLARVRRRRRRLVEALHGSSSSPAPAESAEASLLASAKLLQGSAWRRALGLLGLGRPAAGGVGAERLAWLASFAVGSGARQLERGARPAECQLLREAQCVLAPAESLGERALRALGRRLRQLRGPRALDAAVLWATVEVGREESLVGELRVALQRVAQLEAGAGAPLAVHVLLLPPASRGPLGSSGVEPVASGARGARAAGFGLHRLAASPRSGSDRVEGAFRPLDAWVCRQLAGALSGPQRLPALQWAACYARCAAVLRRELRAAPGWGHRLRTLAVVSPLEPQGLSGALREIGRDRGGSERLLGGRRWAASTLLPLSFGVLLAGGWLAWAGARYLAGYRALARVEASLSQLAAPEPLPRFDEGQVRRLDTLGRLSLELDVAARARPLGAVFGVHAARVRVRRLYRRQLEHALRGPLQRQLRLDLGGARAASAEGPLRVYRSLRALLVGCGLGRMPPGALARDLGQLWRSAYESGLLQVEPDGALHAEALTRVLLDGDTASAPCDEALVERARHHLASTDLAQARLGSVQARLAGAAGVALPSEFRRAGELAVVSPLYTSAGAVALGEVLRERAWEQTDPWVLAEASPGLPLQRYYEQRREQAWSERVQGLELEGPAAGEGCSGWLARLASQGGPYARLAALARRHLGGEAGEAGRVVRSLEAVAREALAPGAPFRLPSRLAGEEASALLRFAGAPRESQSEAPLGRYLAVLWRSSQAEGSDPGAGLAPARQAVQRLLDEIGGSQRAALRSVLLEPMVACERSRERRRAAAREERWTEQVRKPYRALARLYPLQRGASEAAAPSAVRRLLGPRQGSLWQLVDESLGEVLREGAGGYRCVDRERCVSPAALRCLARARRAADALFPPAGEEGAVHGRLASRALVAGSISIQLGEREVALSPEREQLLFEGGPWPSRVRLRASAGKRGYELTREGDWALQRLLDGAELRQAVEGAEALEVIWRSSLGAIALRLRASRPGALAEPAPGPLGCDVALY